MISTSGTIIGSQSQAFVTVVQDANIKNKSKAPVSIIQDQKPKIIRIKSPLKLSTKCIILYTAPRKVSMHITKPKLFWQSLNTKKPKRGGNNANKINRDFIVRSVLNNRPLVENSRPFSAVIHKEGKFEKKSLNRTIEGLRKSS